MADVSTVRTTALARSRWTSTLVAERLEEAADVLSRLPDRKAGGLYDLWPNIIGAPYASTAPAAAAPEAIDRMDVAIGWLCWLEPEERRLVWLRAEGLPWSASRTGWASVGRRPGSGGPRRCSRSRSG